MHQRYDDTEFHNADITGARFHMTFLQGSGVFSHRIRAIHVHPDTGVERRFFVQFFDDKRRTEFVEGLGAHIERLLAASDAAGSFETDVLETPAVEVIAMGTWQRISSTEHAFVAAKWAWKNEQGVLVQNGALPGLESAIDPATATRH